MGNINLCGVLINGTPLSNYGGAALLDYSVGETKLDTETFVGINRTSWKMLKAIYGTRPLKLTIIFTGKTLKMAKLQRSKLNSVFFAPAVIYIADDGFFYDVSCTSLGAEELVGIGETEAKVKATYTFEGIRREALETVTIPAGGGGFFCRSTMPYTDARLTVTVGATASSYTLGGATFGAVTAGDVLVFDGIDGMITRNGANAAASVNWTNFPQLVPGVNTIEALDAVTVEYFPSYI